MKNASNTLNHTWSLRVQRASNHLTRNKATWASNASTIPQTMLGFMDIGQQGINLCMSQVPTPISCHKPLVENFLAKKVLQGENSLRLHAYNHLQMLIQTSPKLWFQERNWGEQPLVLNRSQNVDNHDLCKFDKLREVLSKMVVPI